MPRKVYVVPLMIELTAGDLSSVAAAAAAAAAKDLDLPRVDRVALERQMLEEPEQAFEALLASRKLFNLLSDELGQVEGLTVTGSHISRSTIISRLD